MMTWITLVFWKAFKRLREVELTEDEKDFES